MEWFTFWQSRRRGREVLSIYIYIFLSEYFTQLKHNLIIKSNICDILDNLFYTPQNVGHPSTPHHWQLYNAPINVFITPLFTILEFGLIEKNSKYRHFLVTHPEGKNLCMTLVWILAWPFSPYSICIKFYSVIKIFGEISFGYIYLSVEVETPSFIYFIPTFRNMPSINIWRVFVYGPENI